MNNCINYIFIQCEYNNLQVKIVHCEIVAEKRRDKIEIEAFVNPATSLTNTSNSFQTLVQMWNGHLFVSVLIIG
jgi:hypothetical protein